MKKVIGSFLLGAGLSALTVHGFMAVTTLPPSQVPYLVLSTDSTMCQIARQALVELRARDFNEFARMGHLSDEPIKEMRRREADRALYYKKRC